jgi:hypothetical protein
MRYFAKITTTFALALVFSAGIAQAQTSGFNAEVQLDQVGQGNNATVTQEVNDFADIYQEGGALAVINQGFNENGDSNGKGPNTVVVDQFGANAAAYIDQKRGKGEVYLKQEGNTYTDYDDLKKGDLKGYTDKTANQVSEGEQTRMDIDFGGTPYGKARVDQYGENNIINVDVSGGSFAPTVKVRQGKEESFSRDNEVQIDTPDFVDVSQTGMGGHFAEVNQGGNGTATVTQSGSMHRTVVNQTGGSSTANITQTGTP